MKNKVRLACAAVLTGTMALSMGAPGFTQNVPGIAISVKAEDTAEQAEEEMDRSGNVYIEAEADGTVKKITVTDGLEGSAAAEEQPVSVKVRYYLDGKEKTPEEMAGVSGKVTIRFEYENHTSESVEVDGKRLEVPVPFMVISAVILPTDKFSNVEVSDGKIIAGEEQNIAAGIALPGIADSLKLRNYELTEEISVPDSVEVTADVTDFELELTATIVTPCGLDEMDLEDLNDIEELTDAMGELTDASTQLVNGIGTLADGLNEFQSYLTQYTEGVNQVNEGAKALADGLAVMDSSKEQLTEGAAALQTGLENLQAALAQVSIPSGGGEEMQKAAEAAALLWEDAESLAGLSEGLRSQFETISSGLEGIDPEQIAAAVDEEATRQAQEQAKAEAEAALASILEQIGDEEVSPEMKQQITEAMSGVSFEEIQISGAADEMRQQMEVVEQEVQAAAEVIDIESAIGVLTDMQSQLEILASYSEQIDDLGPQIAGFNTALEELTDGIDRLVSGSSQLSQGIAALDNGIGEASRGAAALSSGVSELASAGSQLNTGFSALTEGTSVLREGMLTFDREGIQELSKLAGPELTEVVTRFRALKEAEKSYNEKAGLEEREIDSIKFIIETEEISSED